MSRMANYVIQQVQPTIYLNNANQAVNGFVVYVYLPKYDEVHQLRLPNISEATVKAAAEKLLADRDALANLGK